MKAITENAMIKRINRKLANEGQKLRKCRSNSRWRHDLGDYYIVDLATNGIVCSHVPLGDLGQELDVLTENERVIR